MKRTQGGHIDKCKCIQNRSDNDNFPSSALEANEDTSLQVNRLIFRIIFFKLQTS